MGHRCYQISVVSTTMTANVTYSPGGVKAMVNMIHLLTLHPCILASLPFDHPTTCLSSMTSFTFRIPDSFPLHRDQSLV
jgi:hypothetical protein